MSVGGLLPPHLLEAVRLEIIMDLSAYQKFTLIINIAFYKPCSVSSDGTKFSLYERFLDIAKNYLRNSNMVPDF